MRLFKGKTTLEVALDGKAGDALAAYVAEGLVGSDFIPGGETESDIRSSIEARAYVNWLKTEPAKRGTFLMTAEDTRTAFIQRHRLGAMQLDQTREVDAERMVRFNAALEHHQRESGMTKAGASIPAALLPHGDAWEAADA